MNRVRPPSRYGLCVRSSPSEVALEKQRSSGQDSGSWGRHSCLPHDPESCPLAQRLPGSSDHLRSLSGFGGFRQAAVVPPVSWEDPVMMRLLSLALPLAFLAATALPNPAQAQNPGPDLIPEDALAGFAIKNLDDLRAKGDKLAKDLQVP